MLTDGLMKESLTKPKEIHPLSVPTKGKRRLILDLRYGKSHLYKDRVKFGDSRNFENYLEC